jgi:hypothetical protein
MKTFNEWLNESFPTFKDRDRDRIQAIPPKIIDVSVRDISTPVSSYPALVYKIDTKQKYDDGLVQSVLEKDAKNRAPMMIPGVSTQGMEVKPTEKSFVWEVHFPKNARSHMH